MTPKKSFDDFLLCIHCGTKVFYKDHSDATGVYVSHIEYCDTKRKSHVN